MALKKIYLNSFLIYPFISCVIWTYAYSKYPDFLYMEVASDLMTKVFPFPIDVPIKIALFGIVFGYVYGTISTVAKARSFKGILFIPFLIFKLIVTMLLAATFGILAIGLEIIILPLIILFIKKQKREKQRKLELQRENEYTKLKNEIIEGIAEKQALYQILNKENGYEKN
ncbi:hypothetical protein [Heyndrickxia sporothermodurans]|uniref:hypothetical protein n=1 Tax=Heyndrickxia sporothermodurans TaxID=46224 RepID=UPI000D35E35E|nr:hypothetical protein [Heyndrickxia sporothermodurans]PTY81020.1 hypothetical protein B5V90_21195 [Heyndrickxia sporothermodurans]